MFFLNINYNGNDEESIDTGYDIFFPRIFEQYV
jgi:hypothetical protein